MSRIASRDPSTPRLTARLSRSDLLWVANTAHGPAGHWHARIHGDEPAHDHLESPESAVKYLADHRLPVPDEPLDAIALRELAIVRAGVERLLAAEPDPWTAESRALLADAGFAVDTAGRIESRRPGWRGLSRDLLIPFLGLIEERAELRRCANPYCRLVFEDGSRNHGRRWCDTAGCGNRDRVRRARMRAGAAASGH